MENTISQKIMDKLLLDQQDEITAHHIYKKIASTIKDKHNREIVEHIADDELEHYANLKKVTGKEIKPQKMKVLFFYCLTKLLGLTFGVKLLEKAEIQAADGYAETSEQVENIENMAADEERHEQELIAMINEERLNYIGSVVLGLNDALVELTGALAGYTFAFQNTQLIALTGLITGISASFSMAASEYLSTRQEGGKDAVKSSIYTGIAYVFTVVFLILPFLFIGNAFISLGCSLLVAVLIILVFNYYISVAKDYNFKTRFLEMTVISLGVAGISFLIGIVIKQFIGVDI